MGGAFVALADDATAAYSNPAGLTLLERREISIEQRAWRSQNPYTERGRISGSPSGVGIDTNAGLIRRETSDRTDNLSFISYVETASERSWALALYGHTLADFSTSFTSEGVFSDRGSPRFGPYRFRTDFEVKDLGIAYSQKFGSCVQASHCLRIGGGLAYYDLTLAASEEVLPDPNNNGPADFNTPSMARSSTSGDDAAVAGNLGLIFETSHSWRFAFAYRQGPSFEIRQNIFNQDSPGQFHLPDQWAAGVAFQPTSALTISAEVDRVMYSSLLQDNRLEDFDLEDGDEIRLGIEYVFFIGDPLQPTRLALMAGGWSDPGHRLSYSGPVLVSGDLFRYAYFPESGGRTEHLSAGLGVNFRNFQFDVGCDRSPDLSTCALSAVTRF